MVGELRPLREAVPFQPAVAVWAAVIVTALLVSPEPLTAPPQPVKVYGLPPSTTEPDAIVALAEVPRSKKADEPVELAAAAKAVPLVPGVPWAELTVSLSWS